jgi:hypothetical protein
MADYTNLHMEEMMVSMEVLPACILWSASSHVHIFNIQRLDRISVYSRKIIFSPLAYNFENVIYIQIYHTFS